MPLTDRSTPPALPIFRFNCISEENVFVTPWGICPLKRTRPDASETKSQLFARTALITTSTPCPVETVGSSVGTTSSVAVGSDVASGDAVGVAVSSTATGISSGVEPVGTSTFSFNAGIRFYLQ